MATDDMHIGFDMDGVLMDHTTWKQLLARKFGYVLTAAQTASDAMKALVPDGHRREIQRLVYSDDAYALSAALMPGARELLTTLKSSGIRFTLVSRRKNPDVARLLLEKHGLSPEFFGPDNTVFVSTVQEKAETCARLGVTHYIDDETGVLGAMSAVPHRYLMDPHGNTAPEDGVAVVRSLREFGMRITGDASAA